MIPHSGDPSAPLRVCIIQPLTPHYRVPVFAGLAARPGIELSVWSDLGQQRGSLKSVRADADFEQIDAPMRPFGPLVSQPMQLEAARCGRFDVIVFGWNIRYLQLSRALRTARRGGTATILWGHGFSKNESRLARALRNRVGRLADACLLYNHAAARRLIDEGFAADRVFVAPNAIDQAPIEAARRYWLARPEEIAAFRREHGIVGRNLVVFLSRIEPDKRVDLLIRAFARVRDIRPDARLAIIGDGSDLDRLRRLAAELGVAERCVFAGAVYDDMKIAPWCLSAACFAYPVAIGLSILHAFGYGLPVITSDDISSHNPEIEGMQPGVNGLLYRDGDVDDFASRIISCLDDAGGAGAMSAAALQTVAPPDGYTVERMVDGMLAAIRSAAARRRAHGAINPRPHA